MERKHRDFKTSSRLAGLGYTLAALAAAPGVPMIAVSSLRGEGLEPLAAFLEPGSTVALVGSSGAGKSTLLNRLCGGEVMRTGAVREDRRPGRFYKRVQGEKKTWR